MAWDGRAWFLFVLQARAVLNEELDSSMTTHGAIFLHLVKYLNTTYLHNSSIRARRRSESSGDTINININNITVSIKSYYGGP